MSSAAESEGATRVESKATLRSRATSVLLSVLLVAVALGAGFVLLLATGQDDPYITFWPAYTLIEFGEILNYNGERVEQSSSLLHTLVLAASAWMTGAPLPLLAYWLGVVFGGVAAVRSVSLARRLGWGGPATLALLVASSPCFLYWCFGSLETTIAAWLSIEVAILAVRIVSEGRSALSPRALATTAAFLTVRPEGGLVLGVALAGWLAIETIVRRSRPAGECPAGERSAGERSAGERSAGERPPVIARAARWLAVVAVLFAGLCLFRLLYFGQIFPQPVMVKVGGDLVRRVLKGGLYVAGLMVPPYGPVMLLALVLVPFVVVKEMLRARRNHALLLVLLLLVAHAGFVVVTGGDWMPGRRFVVHFMPLGLVVLYGILKSARLPRGAHAAALSSWLLVNVAGVVLFAMTGNSGRPLWAFLEKDAAIRASAGGFEYAWPERANQVHARDVLMLDEIADIVERMLVAKKEAGRDDRVSLMSGQAGMVNYYLARRFYGRVEFVDRFALSTRHMMPAKKELGLSATAFGLRLPLEVYFEEGRSREGSHWHPDLIVEIDPRLSPAILRNGYKLLFEQTGRSSQVIEREDSALHPLFGSDGVVVFDIPIMAYQIVAVSDEWDGRVDPPRHRFDWSRERPILLREAAER